MIDVFKTWRKKNIKVRKITIKDKHVCSKRTKGNHEKVLKEI